MNAGKSDRYVCIIQARMGSSRLPGKVLEDIAGQSMLARVVSRVRRSKAVTEVVVATTTEAKDDPLVGACERLDVPVFRGDEQDVLRRYHDAARRHRADAVVRVTADCPLIDSGVIDTVIAELRRTNADYASNTLERTFPRGLDVEVFRLAALERADREAVAPHEREHVTPFLYERPDAFRLQGVRSGGDYGGYRWTVDTRDDLAMVRAIYERLGEAPYADWRSVLALLEREPRLAQMNEHVRQKALREKA